jgi:hypothetical protein
MRQDKKMNYRQPTNDSLRLGLLRLAFALGGRLVPRQPVTQVTHESMLLRSQPLAKIGR